jgi:integrase
LPANLRAGRFLVAAEMMLTVMLLTSAGLLIKSFWLMTAHPPGFDPGTAHVFGNDVGEPINNVKKAWRGACRRAKIAGLNFHDLRWECGSRWLEGGVGLLTVSALLGHTQVTTTNTYLASSPAVAEDELRAFEAGRGNAFPNLSQTASPDPSGVEKASEAVH